MCKKCNNHFKLFPKGKELEGRMNRKSLINIVRNRTLKGMNRLKPAVQLRCIRRKHSFELRNYDYTNAPKRILRQDFGY